MTTRQAIMYARGSTVGQGKGYSLQTQLESCRAYAQEQSCSVVSEFTDHPTGTELDRPGLNSCFSELHKGWLVIDEEEARGVRQRYAGLLEGQSCYAIARTLYEQQILTRGDLDDAVTKKAQPGAWSPSTVRRMVANERYKGIWYFGKTRRQKVNGKTVQRTTPQEDWIAVDVPLPSQADEEGLLQFAEGIQASLQQVDFETRRRVLELRQVRVDVVSQKEVKLSALLPFSKDARADYPSASSEQQSDALAVSGSIVNTSHGLSL